jgi:hypothetical protein
MRLLDEVAELGLQSGGVFFLLLKCTITITRVAPEVAHIELDVLRIELLLLNLEFEEFW